MAAVSSHYQILLNVLLVLKSPKSNGIPQQYINELNYGDLCTIMKNNKRGICVNIEECESVTRSYGYEWPQICSDNGFHITVCCELPGITPVIKEPSPKRRTNDVSSSKRPTKESISEKKCREYAKLARSYDENSCGGSIGTRILDGDPSAPREFPHMVNIGYIYGNLVKWGCGGTLISENFVMSAAHCSKTPFGEPKLAVIGELDTSSTTDDAQPERRRIIRIINHPNYQNQQKYNDIALYKLEGKITFNAYKRPACLNTKKDIQKIRSATAIGWGNTAEDGRRSSRLLKVDLPIIDHKTCQTYFSNSISALKDGIDDLSMICAGDLRGSKDTCQGDSGGPLQVLLDSPECMYSIIGITSFGGKCGTKRPAIYTRVSNFVPWIESIVWP